VSNHQASDRVDSGEHDLNLLAAFAEDRLDAAERRRVIEHVSVCGDCRRTLAALARDAAQAQAHAPVRIVVVRPQVWLPLAAAVLVAAALAVWMSTSKSTSAPERTPVASDTHEPTRQAPTPPAPTEVPRSDAVPRRPERTQPPPQVEGLIARRGAERTVAGKTFRLVAGEWIDSAYDRLAGLPVVDVSTAADRSALLDRLPALKPYLDLGNRVTVVHDGTVYRVDTPPPQ